MCACEVYLSLQGLFCKPHEIKFIVCYLNGMHFTIIFQEERKTGKKKKKERKGMTLAFFPFSGSYPDQSP